MAARCERAHGRRAPAWSRALNTLFDSTVLIDHLRGNEPATRVIEALTKEERLASVLSRVEIEGGMRSHERAEVSALFTTMTLVPVSDAVARRAAEHLRRFRRSHPGIDVVDYVIAATAQLHSAELATLNVRHFPMFPRLKPPY